MTCNCSENVKTTTSSGKKNQREMNKCGNYTSETSHFLCLLCHSFRLCFPYFFRIYCRIHCCHLPLFEFVNFDGLISAKIQLTETILSVQFHLNQSVGNESQQSRKKNIRRDEPDSCWF